LRPGPVPRRIRHRCDNGHVRFVAAHCRVNWPLAKWIEPDMLERTLATILMHGMQEPLSARDISQAGAICCRWRDENGQFEVLLIDSRRTGRWGIPKGHIEPGETTSAAAEREAFEEAGVKGATANEVFGTYSYCREHEANRYCVSVHLLFVSELSEDYPESGLRKARWVPITAAASEADHPDLKLLFYRLQHAAKRGAFSLFAS